VDLPNVEVKVVPAGAASAAVPFTPEKAARGYVLLMIAPNLVSV
jgi:hypothetical protein